MGIIPARAGFTPGRRRSPGRGSDHPRSRGVYAVLPAGVQTGNGSSPLARGLQNEPSADTQPRRIIPARAGFTAPRTRVVCLSDGSSPLARGLLALFFAEVLHAGIIPARAGFTRQDVRPSSLQGDHPRSRGVYRRQGVNFVNTTGSSPLARGLLTMPVKHATETGIIPARAGFTQPGRLTGHSEPDHPRSRGVYATPTNGWTRIMGSSPLARGLQGRQPCRERLLGIIPARAGFTRRRGSTWQPPTDHPRSRGVYESRQG